MNPLLSLVALLSGCQRNDTKVTNDEALSDRPLDDKAIATSSYEERFRKYLLGDQSIAEPRHGLLDIEKLIASEMDFLYQHVMSIVFLEIAAIEVRKTSNIDTSKKKYDKDVLLPSEYGCPAGSEGEYKCSHLVHFVATRCGIQNPTEKEVLVLGSNRVLRTVHLSDILLLKYPERELMNITGSGTPMLWNQKHLDIVNKYITTEYTRLKDDSPITQDELEEIYYKLKKGKILIMVWSPRAGSQYGHMMIIKRIPFAFKSNNLEVDANLFEYDEAVHYLSPEAIVIEAGTAVTSNGEKSIQERGRDVAIFSYNRESFVSIADRYETDNDVKSVFNRELWNAVQRLDSTPWP